MKVACPVTTIVPKIGPKVMAEPLFLLMGSLNLFENPPRHHFIQDEVVLEGKFRLAGMGKDVDLIESRRIHRLHLKAAQITSHGNDQPGRRLKGIGAIQRTTVLVIAPLGLLKAQV